MVCDPTDLFPSVHVPSFVSYPSYVNLSDLFAFLLLGPSRVDPSDLLTFESEEVW